MTGGGDPLGHGWWLVARASGVVSLTCVTLAVLLGLAMAGRLARRPGAGGALRTWHEQLALSGLVALGVHGATLLGDPWLHPGPLGVLVPGQLDYRPWFTAAGIVAGWLAALLGLSFYARRRIGAARWRALHRFTVLVFVLAVVHTLGAGTDAGSWWLRGPVLAAAAVASVLALRRWAGPGGPQRGRPRRSVRPSSTAAHSNRPKVAAMASALTDQSASLERVSSMGPSDRDVRLSGGMAPDPEVRLRRG